jgi:hypothetical protein
VQGIGGATQGACLAEPRKARFPARSAGNAPKLHEISVNVKLLKKFSILHEYFVVVS